MSTKNNIELWNLEIYKKIVEHMNESLWIWDEENNTIYANNIFSEISWYTLEEIIWKNYSVFWNDKSIALIKNLKFNNKETKKIKYEALIKAKNWNIIPVLCSWTPTEKWWTVLMISDLRELKSLKEAEENLIKINNTKDEFISIVWHELRTPLTSIRWYLSMILEWDMWDITEETKKALWHSYNSSVRLIELVNDVLSIWKIESWKIKYNYEYYKITDIVNSVYDDINLAMKDKLLNFYIDFDQNLRDLTIKTDKDKLKQVFINLLTNALKFTNEWWNITLKSTKIWNKVLFEIIDNWIGIEKEKIETLFSKFSQVESSLQRQNTSWLWLWLAICDNFIKEFNSDIKVKSETWKWSNFSFELDIV